MTFCVCLWRWRLWLWHTTIRTFSQHANNKICANFYRIDYVLWIYCTFDAIQAITDTERFVCMLLNWKIPKAEKLNPSTSAVSQNRYTKNSCNMQWWMVWNICKYLMETGEIIMRLNAFAIRILYTRLVYYIFYDVSPHLFKVEKSYVVKAFVWNTLL